jgi:hypothetical protein
MFQRLLANEAFWWLAYVACIALFFAAFEVGYRYGRRWRPRADEERKALTGTLVAGMLALMSFLLATSFGIAADRFGQRKALVLAEANAIRTAFLRTDFLPEPQRSNLRRLFPEYVELRIRAVETGVDVPEAIARAEAMQGAMWAEIAAVARVQPAAETVALAIQSVNDVIDLHRARVTVALRYRIPPIMLQALFGIALLAMGTMGVQFGLGGTRNLPVMLGLLMAFGSVLLIVVELDRPTRRVYRVDMHPLIETLKAMRPTPGEP